MKKFNEMGFAERKEIKKMFTTWLRPYTHEVIVKVIQRRDEIINNESTMNLLRELHTRSEKEAQDFYFSIGMLLESCDEYSEYDPHNHPISHAGSYRDVLYDMYIKENP